MLRPFFLQTEPAAPLILPDSVQKERFAEAVQKLMALDLSQVMRTIIEQALWVSIKIVLALFFYFVGRWIIRRIVGMLNATFERREVEASLRSFIRNTVSVILTLILILIVVQTLGVNVTSLIAVFSAATLAIGMALSGTAQNFAGGVMILVVKPYRVGDFITAQGQSGTVKEIKLFSTVIATTDNQTIYIPNNVIATSIIDNYTTAPLRRVDWSISLAYGDDVELARKTILELLAEDDRVLHDPAPVVWLQTMGDSAIVLTVRAWTANAHYWDVYFMNNERFYNILPERGLHFPFPQLDVHIANDNK